MLSIVPDEWDRLVGPSDGDLAAIEAEMPLILAELGLVEAEIVAIEAPVWDVLAVRRLRRAQHRVLVAAARVAGVSGVVAGGAA